MKDLKMHCHNNVCRNNMPNITLNNYIKSLSLENKDVEIRKLSNLFPEVKEYYQAKLSGVGETTLLEKYIRVINKEFRSDDHPGRARLSIARKAVNDFIKICTNDMNQAEIMIQYVEAGIRFTNAYGDIDEPFYNSMTAMLNKALKFISLKKVPDIFKDRVAKMVSSTEHIGWGFHDEISELYLQHFQK